MEWNEDVELTEITSRSPGQADKVLCLQCCWTREHLQRKEVGGFIHIKLAAAIAAAISLEAIARICRVWLGLSATTQTLYIKQTKLPPVHSTPVVKTTSENNLILLALEKRVGSWNNIVATTLLLINCNLWGIHQRCMGNCRYTYPLYGQGMLVGECPIG